MEKIKGILDSIINGDSKTRLVVTSLVSIVLVSVLLLGSTYSLFTTSSVDEDLNVYKTGNLDITYTLSSENIKLNDSTPISDDESIYIEPYRITISNSGNVPYMFNIILDDSTATDVISYEYIMTKVGKLDAVRLSKCEDNIIRKDVIVPAGEEVVVDVRVFLANDIKNTELGKSFYAKLSVDGIAVYNENKEVDNSILVADVLYKDNAPKLDDGLIPVYYDEENSVWKKADVNNKDNSWYSYEDKRWANAVLIEDPDMRGKYIASKKGTEIVNEDIMAFFVWIPRFKYRVWNITRDMGEEEVYSYPAYSTGIEIEWEKNINNTGNVNCTYNINDIEADNNFVDTCTYNGEEITIISENSDYKDAWYTHPAFTNNGDIEGFWIGKYETYLKEDKVSILENDKIVNDLKDTKVNDLFNMSNSFMNYGLKKFSSSNINNLEWGAVTYLINSTYGICDKEGCNTENIVDVYGMNDGAREVVMGSMIDNNADTSYELEGLLYSYGTSSNDKKANNRMRLGDGTVEFSGIKEISGSIISEDEDFYSIFIRGGNITNSNMFDYQRYNDVWNEEIGSITGRTVLK